MIAVKMRDAYGVDVVGCDPSRRMPISVEVAAIDEKFLRSERTWNEVCSCPPAPKASPQPMIVSRMAGRAIL